MCGTIEYPTTSLLHRSTALARYSHPSAVAKQLMSPTSFNPGIGALKSRRFRPAIMAAPGSALVRFRRLLLGSAANRVLAVRPAVSCRAGALWPGGNAGSPSGHGVRGHFL